MSLNHAQQEACAHREGPCMVLAGPGSGKTLTITKRIEYLINKYKVRPEEILVITFTKYAANEMRRRFRSLVSDGGYPVTFGTFHGIYYGILKCAYRLGPGNLLAEDEKTRMLSHIVDRHRMGKEASAGLEDMDYIRDLAAEIGKVKNNGLNIDEYTSSQCGAEEFRSIYRSYEMDKKVLRKIDFEDMLALCLELLQKHPDILDKWQNKFRYILVDEFQDINQVQYDVIRMLAKPDDNLFVVGDDDQSIYGFRGARPGIMLGFGQDYPGARRILLDVNYRSGAHIVDGAMRVIRHNEKRFVKKIYTGRTAGDKIRLREEKDPRGECRYVIKRIKECVDGGASWNQIAVLYRTSLDAGLLSEMMMERQVPFHMNERADNIYGHFTGRDIISYLNLAQGSRERRHFLRIANRPVRYIGRAGMEQEKVTFEALRRYYWDKEWMLDKIDRMECDIRTMKDRTPYCAIQYIRRSIGYDAFIKDYAAKRKLPAESWLQTLDEIQESAKEYRDIESWMNHIDRYALFLKSRNDRDNKIQDGVSLLTIHKAKGLEFDTVFLIGANEGTIPYQKAVSTEDVEEERRLFYVAMTRAKRKLFISYVKEKNGKNKSPSRFINELLGVI